jgi:hypothetical protein
MTFQTHVNIYPAPGVVGARASQNPIKTVVAGQAGLVAGANGLVVGKFAWNSYPNSATAQGNPGQANNYSPTLPTIPDGFVANNQQATNTIWLQEYGMVIPAGYPVTEMDEGDFWAKNPYADANIGQKVFVNLFSGDVVGGAAGAFITDEVGNAAVIASATIAAGSNSLNIITLSSGVPEVGDQVFGLNIPGPVFIEAFGTFNGSSGTVFLTQYAVTTQTTVGLTTLAPVGTGGGVVAATGTNGSTTITISSVTNGQVKVGQPASGTGIPAGAYIASFGTFDGTSGTVILSAAATSAVSGLTSMSLSAFIETPWKILSAANVGDIVKIGIRY